MSRNKYTSISGGGLLSSGVDSVISRIDNGLIGRGYQTVGNYVEDAYNAAQRGYKIVMAEAGIAKQLLRGGAAYSYDEMGNVAVTVNSPFVSRNDRYSALWAGTTRIRTTISSAATTFCPSRSPIRSMPRNTRHRPSWWTDPSYSSGYTKSRRSYR